MSVKLLFRLPPLHMCETLAPFSLDKTVDTISAVPLATPSVAPPSPTSSEVDKVPTFSLTVGDVGLVLTIAANAIIASLWVWLRFSFITSTKLPFDKLMTEFQ